VTGVDRHRTIGERCSPPPQSPRAKLPELLLNVATVRPVFLWGAPGIGKSSLVRQFADSLGLPCVSLLGTQLAPEDLIGVPQIIDGRSRVCPPEMIARDEPYCLFLDELNAASPDVQGLGDVLHEPLPRIGETSKATDLDDFYRRALLTRFEYHKAGRGLLPAGLEQEIRALEHPPLRWDAELARWFDEYVPRVEPTRSYARPSRRQSSTPDIPRPGRHHPTEPFPRATFGVVLDTSASMDVRRLGKALGAIASYALARDVPAARVVYCDAAPHDAGYVPVEDIGSRLRVKGRGGTVLQPGIRLLQKAKDFPPDAPILVITDGECDPLSIQREHAFLIPAGARLPFKPRGPVFSFR
jgi:hypothetical protein